MYRQVHRYPATKLKLQEVEKMHRSIAQQYPGEEEAYQRILTAANLGRKKGIMTEERLREMCDCFLARFNKN